jgi:hypothetical protein
MSWYAIGMSLLDFNAFLLAARYACGSKIWNQLPPTCPVVQLKLRLALRRQPFFYSLRSLTRSITRALIFFLIQTSRAIAKAPNAIPTSPITLKIKTSLIKSSPFQNELKKPQRRFHRTPIPTWNVNATGVALNVKSHFTTCD